MGSFSTADAGRAAVLAGVLLQAGGKVAYGTLLATVPSPVFVLVGLALAAALFLAFARKGAGRWAWGPLIVLNVCTAVTFLSFFHALKLIEPAIAVALNIGVGPVLALLIAWRQTGERPTAGRLIVCVGVAAGCAVLCVAAFGGTGVAARAGDAWLGLAAAAIAGIGTVLITVASRSLVELGWQSGAVLAHRFYLAIPAALVLSLGADVSAAGWTPDIITVLLAVAVAGVLAPLYLFQFGIRRCDPYTVMVTMTALPVVTFLVEGLSPAYRWSWPTAVGLAILTASLLVDVVRARRGAAPST